MAPSASSGSQPAPLARRIAAYVLDWLLAIGIALLLIALVATLLLLASDVNRRDPPDWSLYLSLAILAAWLPIWFVSTTILWLIRGASIGMLSAGICVADRNGSLPRLVQAAGRAIALALMTGPAVSAPLLATVILTLHLSGPLYVAVPTLGLVALSATCCVSVLFRRDHRAWHDLLTGTQVVMAPGRRRVQSS